MVFFQLNTPKDMLGKAKRELTRLETADSMAADSIDHVYNFFVTAYHIVDYLKGRLAEPDIKAIKAEPLIQSCYDACNKAKHMQLTRKRPDVVTPTKYTAFLGGSPNTPDKSLERWIVWQDGTNLEVISFARSVIAKWDEQTVSKCQAVANGGDTPDSGRCWNDFWRPLDGGDAPLRRSMGRAGQTDLSGAARPYSG
jgi:hypothetical protein